MPEDELEQIRRNLSTERAIKRAATDWTDDSGGDRVGRCTHPEHGHTSSGTDGTPNVIVTDDGGWYCYSHSTGGGIFEWIAVEEGICACDRLPLSDEQFKDALQVAADRAGVELSNGGSPANYEEALEDGRLSDEDKAQYALEEAVDILHDNLDTVIDGMSVRRNIKERRPFDDETIDEARIGFLDDGAHAKLLESLSKDALRDIGILDDDGSLHARGFIVYPYLDGNRPRYWVGRKHPETDHPAKYLKPASNTCILEQPLYTYRPTGARDDEGIWVVEGIQDCIATAQNGDLPTVSPVATNPSQKQLNELLPLTQEKGRAVICFDADGGGDGDSVDLALEVMSAGVQTSIASLPPDTDPCDYVMGGGDIADLETRPAAEVIIERRGDSDPLIEDILATTASGTPRADRLIDTISKCTPLRKPTLRDMMEEERVYEQQRAWREPDTVRKTSGSDTTWIFVYDDGTQIRMDSITSREAPNTFSEKFGAAFNFFPDISRSEWMENVNTWMAEVRVIEVSPLTPEGRTKERIQEQIQSSQAVPHKDDLAAVGDGYVSYYDDNNAIIVPSDVVSEWVDDLDVSLRQAREYLEPLLYSDTKRLTVDGVRTRFWLFDVDTISDNGYATPEPSGVPDQADDTEEAGSV